MPKSTGRYTPVEKRKGYREMNSQTAIDRREDRALKIQNRQLRKLNSRTNRKARSRHGLTKGEGLGPMASQKERNAIIQNQNNQLTIKANATRIDNEETRSIATAFATLENYVSGVGDEFENGSVLNANAALSTALVDAGYDQLAKEVTDYGTKFKSYKHYDDATFARAMLDIRQYQQSIRDRIDVDYLYQEVLDSAPTTTPSKNAPIDPNNPYGYIEQQRLQGLTPSIRYDEIKAYVGSFEGDYEMGSLTNGNSWWDGVNRRAQDKYYGPDSGATSFNGIRWTDS